MTDQPRDAEWPKEGATMDMDMLEVLRALEDLSFECFSPIAPCNRPSLETYNRTFYVLDRQRKRLGIHPQSVKSFQETERTPAPTTLVEDEAQVAEICARIAVAQIASCNCDKKTHEHQYHSITCTYRLLEEYRIHIRKCRQPAPTRGQIAEWYANVWKGYAADELKYEFADAIMALWEK